MNIVAHDPARFVAALLSSDGSVPPGLVDAEASGRFEIYRSNVILGLIRALAARFPATERLVGGAFFHAMARAFARVHPPTSPLLMTYGEAFPDFLRRFPPAADLPYLADVAALEMLRGQSYHAADARPLPAVAFAALPADRIPMLRLRLHPSVALLRSAHPVVTIWAAQQHEVAALPSEGWQAEDALVHRHQTMVKVTLLAPGEAAFLAMVANAETLEEATLSAMVEAPGFEPGRVLALIVTEGLATELLAA